MEAPFAGKAGGRARCASKSTPVDLRYAQCQQDQDHRAERDPVPGEGAERVLAHEAEEGAYDHGRAREGDEKPYREKWSVRSAQVRKLLDEGVEGGGPERRDREVEGELRGDGAAHPDQKSAQDRRGRSGEAGEQG